MLNQDDLERQARAQPTGKPNRIRNENEERTSFRNRRKSKSKLKTQRKSSSRCQVNARAEKQLEKDFLFAGFFSGHTLALFDLFISRDPQAATRLDFPSCSTCLLIYFVLLCFSGMARRAEALAMLVDGATVPISTRTSSPTQSSPASAETTGFATPGPAHEDNDSDSASETPDAAPARNARRSYWSRFGKVAAITGAALGGAAVAVVAAPVVIGAAGFTAGGIAAG